MLNKHYPKCSNLIQYDVKIFDKQYPSQCSLISRTWINDISCNTYGSCKAISHVLLGCTFKEWVSFFLGSWDMNRSAEQTNRVNREAVLVRFVCSALRFISHEPRKKDTHSLYLQCLQQRPLLKFSEQSKKFKFPAEIGHLTLFPDKTIIAYSFRQNSAWINGEKVVCCECFHTLKQY